MLIVCWVIIIFIIIAFFLTWYIDVIFSSKEYPLYNQTVTYDNNNTVKNRVLRTVSSTSLLKNERRKPPSAEFFGKLDGKIVYKTGNLEEQYLNKTVLCI